MIFENINNSSQPENKQIEKHIKLNPNAINNLNAVQLAYKTETRNHINLNELINISVNLFVKEIKKQIANGNEIKAIEYITELKKELEP